MMMGGRGAARKADETEERDIQASLLFLQVSLACMISSARP